jgi:alpha-amylase/alpha-mannosidase (GH57 family)
LQHPTSIWTCIQLAFKLAFQPALKPEFQPLTLYLKSHRLEKYICIHGHFYQPPRENAWLEVIEVQDSAHPYHDWNERISAECYGPNTASRILNEKGVINNIINNYSKISFNFGPTLLSWMESNDRETYDAILEADRQSVESFGGHGSALAQGYNHMIMPLATSRDKETQIIWGIRDFVHRFNRIPEGMWLAETAVDTETLELLVKHNIKFTVLAPRQAKSFRKKDDLQWTSAEKGIDTRRPYEYRLPSGKSIVLFFYDGAISQDVAFDGLLNDGRKLAERLISNLDKTSTEPQLSHIATDGETYGHHHKHGDMALAFCLDYIERNSKVKLTNYAQFLSLRAPAFEAQIHERSSWSCVHGVERWRNDCGCNTGGKPSWNQRWRKPLRDALDWLRDELEKIFVREASPILKDPWVARDEYISVILRRNDETIKKFLRDHCSQTVDPSQVLRLMEVQRNAMLMYTSCGWFFDEVSGIETTQIMQYACRAMQLVSQISEVNLELEFRKRLEEIPSNVPSLGNASHVYSKFVLPSKINLQRVGMHYAVASIFEEDLESFPVFNYSTANEIFIRKEAGEQKLVLGVTKVKSNVTRSEKKFAFAVIYMGKHNIIGNISLDMEEERFASMQARMIAAFEEARLGDVIGLMQTYFGPEKYTIWQLFQDEKRKVFNFITYQSMLDLEDSLRRIYNRDYPLVMALANNGIPIPNAYRTSFEYILNADLIKCFQTEKINIRIVERVMTELVKWDLRIEDPVKVERMAGESIFKELKRLAAERESLKRIERLNRLFPLLERFSLRPNLYRSQNLYFEISKDNHDNDSRSPEWLKQFTLLGENMGVKV